MSSSEPMFAALIDQLTTLAGTAPAVRPPLVRSESVGYLEEKIVPAVKAVHTPEYLEKLASTCVSLHDKDSKHGLVALDADTTVSASSLSAALCAVLSCCYAVDACCDPALPFANAFAVIRPPGHHAGANGPTVGPQGFTQLSTAAATHAQPAVSSSSSTRTVTPPPAFAFTTEPQPCDGMDCSQG